MEEIISGEELKARLQIGIGKLSDTVLATLGPSGGTIIITDDFGRSYVTKDGVSVSNSIKLKDPVENIGANLLKQVAQKTVDEAGDGTTTSICLAVAFIKAGYILMESDKDYNFIKSELEDLLSITVKKLKTNSRKLTGKDSILNVATISANNDKELGKTIQKAYNHSHIVKVEESELDNDKLVTIDGMKLRTSYFSKSFINNGAKQSIDYSDIDILLVDGKLDKMEAVAGLIQNHKKVVIVADHFNESIVNIFKDNYNRGALDIALVKSPGFGKHRRDLMTDLGLYTGATLLSPLKTNRDPSLIGHIDSISVRKEETIITKSIVSDKVGEKLEELEAHLTEVNNSHDGDLLEQRIGNLSGKVSIIRVGGKSEVEVKERKDRYDDAVLAVKSALEEGVVEGAGVALVKITNEVKNSFTSCLVAPSLQIFENSCGAINYGVSDDMFKLNIVDPLKVTRCALENAVSVAKTILSTKAVVLNEGLWT